MRVYIAGPYSGDVSANVRDAVYYADAVVRLGHTPFVPHLCMLWDLISPHPYEDWTDYDLIWLEVCDTVLCIGSSPGSDAEVAHAMDHNIPVYFTLSELVSETSGT